MSRPRKLSKDPGTFAERLHNILAERNLTYMQLDLDGVVAQCSVSNWVRGITLPTSYSLERLCRYLGVSADYLLGLSDRKPLKAKWFFHDGECLCSWCGERGETIDRYCSGCGIEMEVDND